jgi:hypothetical protein
LFLPVKNNLGSDEGGLAYRVEPIGPNSAPIINWCTVPVFETADDFAAAGVGRPTTEREQVIAWLQTFLADGPQPTTEIQQAATAHGYSIATLRRAFRDLGGWAVKEGRNQWLWQLPANEPSPTNEPSRHSDLRLTRLPVAPCVSSEDAQNASVGL